MARWEPDSRGRLAQAAMDLFGERGFDQTTVADIAERAGVTERTFFRLYADKREVLFGGSRLLQDGLVSAAVAAPASASPLDAVEAGPYAAAARLPPREPAMQRQAILTPNPALQERQ